jgi:hypothetical protein
MTVGRIRPQVASLHDAGGTELLDSIPDQLIRGVLVGQRLINQMNLMAHLPEHGSVSLCISRLPLAESLLCLDPEVSRIGHKHSLSSHSSILQSAKCSSA